MPDAIPHPPPLPYIREQSARANARWGANCGPHALAAATGRGLDEVEAGLAGFRGWVNPTMIGAALRSMGVAYSMRKGLRTRDLCGGINRVQWEGRWLDPGVPPAAAYRHTHWVAHREGLVLCTIADPARWVTVAEWESALAASGHGAWHVTHHYRIAPPVTS